MTDPASIERTNRAISSMQTNLNKVSQLGDTILQSVKSGISSTQAYLSSVNFSHHGKRLMETLAQGMKARAQVVVDQIKSTMQEVRNHLPSSPAKVGPLSDIHKLKFGETIAGSIKAEPMVKAMRHAAALTRAAANDNPFSVLARAENIGANDNAGIVGPNPIQARSGANGQSAPSSEKSSRGDININIGDVTIAKDGMSMDEFKEMLLEAGREIADIVDNEDRRKNRRSYG